MRKLNQLLSAFLFCVSLSAVAQKNYMAAPGVAVFYPQNYDAAAHSPSPIFEQDLAPVGDVPASWKIRPLYSVEDGKNVVRIPVDADADLYGGGEVWGPLRRNGKTIEFFNIDTPCYGVDGLQRGAGIGGGGGDVQLLGIEAVIRLGIGRRAVEDPSRWACCATARTRSSATG